MRALASETDVKTRYGGRLRPGSERHRRQPQRAARLVLVRQRLRGRPQRRLVPASRRRCRPGSTTAAGSGRGGARRRRRVPGAVRARLRREDAAGRRSLRTRARSSGRVQLGAELGATKVVPLGTPVPAGCECARGARRCFEPRPASCSARPPAIRCASSGAAIRRPSGGTAFREPWSAALLLARRRYGGAARPIASGRSRC